MYNADSVCWYAQAVSVQPQPIHFAIDTLVHLKDIIKAYGRVTVKDLMDLVGVAPNPDDDRLGWLNVDDTTINLIEQDKEHPYCLMLPHPVSFND